MSQRNIAVVPDAIVAAVNKVVMRYGSAQTRAYYSVDGEAIVEFRDSERGGVGKIHFVASGQGDTWVCATHTVPGHVEPGLPDRFNSNVMYDTTKEWWPSRDGVDETILGLLTVDQHIPFDVIATNAKSAGLHLNRYALYEVLLRLTTSGTVALTYGRGYILVDDTTRKVTSS